MSGSGGREKESEAPQELKQISVELSGREGFNALAVNGVWRFWKVKGSRLAFRRDAELQADQDDGEDAEAPSPRETQTAGNEGGGRTVTVRLYLFYLPQADAWLVSDTPDGSGNIVADCGPVAGAEDLGQHWRVWDGETWKQDRNISAEIFLGGPSPPMLQGLRVVPAAPTRASPRVRAHSQETRPPPAALPPPTVLPRVPSAPRPPDAARIMRTPRGFTSSA